MELTIRKAVKEDCPRMMELIRELALFEKAPEEVTASLDHFTDSGFGVNPVWWGFVAVNEGNILGMANYYIRYSTWKGQLMYLEDLIITEAARGKGIGTLLFERCLKEAAEKKLKGITWQVLDWNEPAIVFYKKYHARFERGWINCSLPPG